MKKISNQPRPIQSMLAFIIAMTIWLVLYQFISALLVYRDGISVLIKAVFDHLLGFFSYRDKGAASIGHGTFAVILGHSL
ncbi:hypothetical protein [Luteimonas panaciterrae]|uniref:hypothetical protein n=1 Tax=Luteimonas panaciterrae TaxID=363885 RepID=UPI001CFB9C4F|nr:hypothetical protein [Luteimonas panaciterrae]